MDDLNEMLDGAVGSGQGLTADDAALLRDELRLQEALRDHATYDRLTADEKGTIASSVAGTLGFAGSGASGGSILGYSLATILGAVLASGFFLIADPLAENNEVTAPTTHALLLDAESTTPSLFPTLVPGPSAADECAAAVTALREEIQELRPKPVAKKRRTRSYRPRSRPAQTGPVTGD